MIPQQPVHKEKAFLLSIASIPGIGNATIRNLLTVFGSPGGIHEAILTDRAYGAIRKEQQLEWAHHLEKRDPEVELQRIQDSGIKVVVQGEKGYPGLLLEMKDPPFILFMRGIKFPGSKPSVAIVGSRKASAYGRSVSRWLASEISRYGVEIVSGAAFGIDGEAHRGALEAGGCTHAVLGCGVDVAYPPAHRALIEKIAGNGSVISEYFPGTQPFRYNFPLRNRIIAGLSKGLIVVEAAEKSGALLTVNHALENGREVFAVPGQVFSDNSRGVNSLIRSGAVPATCAEDVINELGLAPCREGAVKKKEAPEMDRREMQVADLISTGICDVDGISRRMAEPVQNVISILTGMEIRGLVNREPGGIYLLKP